MTRSTLSVSSLLVVFTLVAAACGTQSTPTAAPPTAMPPTVAAPTQAAATEVPATLAPRATPSGPATVTVGKSSQFAAFLTDDKGMTLYAYMKDSPNTATCAGKCAEAWPPLLTAGAPVAGTGADTSKLGKTMRADGNTQVTYNGWPLYYWAKDKQPGDTTGQNVGTVWFVLAPTGDPIKQ
jgi:predicted lipoprotein with Yx(FWY)xxD motif